MALTSAHEGYEYQDLLTAYFILSEILQEREAEFIIDRKEYEGDNIDDLVIVNKDRTFKKQIKYSNPDYNHILSKTDLSTDSSYNLSIDSLYFTWLNHTSRESTDFRICLSWQEPIDELIDILEKVDGLSTFSNDSTKVFKIKGEKLWPKDSQPLSNWKRFRAKSKDIDRNLYLKFCDSLSIEVLMPKISLNLTIPGDLEKIVIEQTKDLGIGVFPNGQMQPEAFILSLLAIIKRSRSKGKSITISSVFHELNIITDYGSIEQTFPVIESENIKRVSAIEDFTNEIKSDEKILLLGEPGSGKSWFIENLMNHIKSKKMCVIRHFCYTDLNDTLQKERIKLNVFYGNLIADIILHYPSLKKIKKQKFASTLNELNHLLQHIKEPTFIIIDGLDHIERIATFRSFSEISLQDRAIIESLEKLKATPFVKIIVTSQNIPELDLIKSFTKKTLPPWTENDIKKLLKKNNIRNKILKKGLNTVSFLSQKSKGNPLYLKYLIDEIKGLPIVTLKLLEKLPEYSFNLSEYYSYLLSHLQLREDVPQILSGVSFSLTKQELKEITNSGEFVDESLQILSPVLKVNLSQSGYSIYHESFRRYIVDHLNSKSISIDKKIFRPILEWFETKNFFSHQKSYRYYLQFLHEGGAFDKILSILNQTFVTDSVVHGQSWKLIEKNYKFFVNAACFTHNLPSIVLLNEINKIISSCPEPFEEIYSIYLEAIGKIYGFQYLSDYLIFEGIPTIPYLDGLKACYICDENNFVAPWSVYMEYFKESKNVDDDNFKYLVRGLLIAKDEERLNRIGKKVLKHSDNYREDFINEFKIYSGREFIESLCNKYESIAFLTKSKDSLKEIYTHESIIALVNSILLMNNIHTEEEKVIKKFFNGVRILINNDALLTEIIQTFTGKNWFYNWLIYYIKIIKISTKPTTQFSEVKEAFDYLTYNTGPFAGKPRACDLYSLHPFIYESFTDGLKLMANEFEWKEIIEALVLVSNKTTTTLQRTLTGPLATDKLFQLLSEFINVKNIDLIIAELEKQIVENSQDHLHTNVAQYNLQLASVYALHQNKDIALDYLKKGIEFSLAYTMHKDLTLLDVIEGVEFYSSINPQKGLVDLKKARILAYSAVLHTDGKESNHFPIMWFKSFLKIDFRKASLYLLNELIDSRYHWWEESSLINLLCHANGSINPEIEAYIALTFPIEDSEKFMIYCLNLHKNLKSSNSSLAEKLMDRIIAGMKPIQNRQRSNEIINIYNNAQEEVTLKIIPKPEENKIARKFVPWYKNISERQPFSLMQSDEILLHFEENNIQYKDLNSFGFFLDTFEELSESIKELIRLIVFKNNKSFYDKVDLDTAFGTGNDIECYYWVCRFVSDSGGWYEKFVNPEAFLKAYHIDQQNAFKFLFELLPIYLEIGFNTLFSSNLIKLLASLNYDRDIIEKCWQNLLDITSYRLPVQEDIEWETVFETEMNIEEIFLAILLSRVKAETSDRYKVTVMALENLAMAESVNLIKPFQWFLQNRGEFSNASFIIVLQYIYKKSIKDQNYHLNFKEDLLKVYPSKYFLIDYIITQLYNPQISQIYNPKGLIYPVISKGIFDFIYYLNYKFRIFETNEIDLNSCFNKYAATFSQKYKDHFKLYGSRIYNKMVRHIYGSEHMMEIFNTECYEEFSLWQLWEEPEFFTLGIFIDTDAIAAHANSCGIRPSDLLRPSEIEKENSVLKTFKGDWIRLGHVETELKKQDTFKTIPYKNFGGIVFSNNSETGVPYSRYALYPIHFWGDIKLDLALEKNIIFSIIQEDPLEYFKLLWLNPKIIDLLKLTVVRNSDGLFANDETGKKILIMRTWSGDYIGEGGYHSSLSDEIPTLEGTDLIIRKDYFEKLCSLFKYKPKYYIKKVQKEFA